MPVWSPDSGRIAFSLSRNGTYDLYQKSINGVGGEELLLADTSIKHPTDWSRDGRYLLYRRFLDSDRQNSGFDLWAVPLSGVRQPIVVAETRFDERDGQFSPDGNWSRTNPTKQTALRFTCNRFLGPDAKSGFQQRAALRCAGGVTAANCSTSRSTIS
jgi:dipeptidyl aminopeptidase/acylaminoacyl peptidase